jgi:hypothetical protein
MAWRGYNKNSSPEALLVPKWSSFRLNHYSCSENLTVW